MQKDKCFLTTYCLVITVVLILEISAASVIVAYEGQARAKLELGLNKTVEAINKDYDKVAMTVMDSIQPVFKCCGCHSYLDYRNITVRRKPKYKVRTFF